MNAPKTAYFKALFCILTLAIALPMSTSLQAQTTETAQQQTAVSTGWGVQCNTVSDELQCSALTSIVSSPGNQLILRVSLQAIPEQENHTLIVQLPLGLDLPKGIDMIVDDGEPNHYEINTCVQAGCFVTNTIDKTVLDLMKTGSTLAVVMHSSNGGENRIELSLTGFIKAVEKLQ